MVRKLDDWFREGAVRHKAASHHSDPDPEPGTCNWILSDPVYEEWLNASEERLLWIVGDPGLFFQTLLVRFRG